MRGRVKYNSTTGFLDLLFNGWLIYVMMFMISFILIVPERNEANIKTKAEFVLTLTWDDGSKDDVDIWVEDPMGNLVYYKDKEKGITHLDRDDLGLTNDKTVGPDGEIITYKHNQEIVTIRGFMAGEWVINIHMYNKRDPTPTNVEVKIIKLNPTAETVFVKKLVMEIYWEEITIARLRMSRTGKILSISETPPKHIIESTRSGNVQTYSDGTVGGL